MEDAGAERCETCRFWVQQCVHVADDVAECHRYPPVLNDQNVAAVQIEEDWVNFSPNAAGEIAARAPCVWARPVTNHDDFCGEWQAKRVPLPVAKDG